MMNFQNFDLFSTQFQFNVGYGQVSKRSTIGAVLSIVVISLSIAYFIYLLFLYLGNQIDPKYKSQTFISDESIKIDYNNDIVGFRYEYEKQQTGKKYLTFIPFLEIVTSIKTIQISLDVIKCENKNLDGYNCLDFSKVSHEYLENNNSENIYKQIVILLYRCPDTDYYKNTIENDCASDKEIENMISKVESRFRIKMLTSQYNTITEQIQSSYKNIIQYVNIDEFLLATFKAVKQITQIKKGPFIQQKTEFSSPIDYISEPRIYNRQITKEQLNLSMQIYMIINVSEQYQQIYIQYATFMEVLAICNSTLAVIMCVGIIGRYFAKQLIKEDISLLLLQNIYQSQYLNSLQKFNIFQNKISEQEINNELKKEDFIENTQSVFIPSFLAKSKETIESNKLNLQDSPKDFILESSQASQQQNYLIKDNKENTIDENELSSERFKFNFLLSNQNSINTEKSNPQQMIKNQQTKSQHQIHQKKRFQTDSQYLNQNQKDIFDCSKNLELLQFNSNDQKSNLNLKPPKHSLIQYLSTPKQNNCDAGQKQFQTKRKQIFENLKAIQDNSFATQFKSLFFKSKCYKRNKPQTNSSFDSIFKKTLNDQVNRNLDIISLYKDMIVLKKAIMVILSNDQYAAIQLIGCTGTPQSTQITSQDEINTEINASQQQQMNHGYLDEQFMISESSQKQVDYINIFLQRWQNNQNLSDIDRRIYSSLIQK